jgi:hypothetical protein
MGGYYMKWHWKRRCVSKIPIQRPISCMRVCACILCTHKHKRVCAITLCACVLAHVCERVNYFPILMQTHKTLLGPTRQMCGELCASTLMPAGSTAQLLQLRRRNSLCGGRQTRWNLCMHLCVNISWSKCYCNNVIIYCIHDGNFNFHLDRAPSYSFNQGCFIPSFGTFNTVQFAFPWIQQMVSQCQFAFVLSLKNSEMRSCTVYIYGFA